MKADSKNKLKNAIIIFFGICIIILVVIIFNQNKKINNLEDSLTSDRYLNSNLTKELTDLKNTIYDLDYQLKNCRKQIQNQIQNNGLSNFSKTISTTTIGGVTTRTVKYHKKCNETVSGSDEGEIIKKCGVYIIVKTFHGYVVAHSWNTGNIGDDVEGNIWWGIGWEDWLIDCKKVNVKIESKGDWEEVSKWIKDNC